MKRILSVLPAMKKAISVLVALMLSVASGVPTLAESGSLPELWAQELSSAGEIGISLEKADQETITGREMMEMLDHLVAYTAPDRETEWKAMYGQLRTHDQPLTRFDAMGMCYLAADFIGGAYSFPPISDFPEPFKRMNWQFDAYYFTEGLFDGIDGPHFNAPFFGEGNYLDGVAFFYNLTRVSPVSGEYPFPYDSENNSIHEWDKPSYTEAALAVARMKLIADADDTGDTGNTGDAGNGTEYPLSEMQKAELSMALDIGLADETKIGDNRITGAEYADMLDFVLKMSAPEQIDSWLKDSERLRDSKAPLVVKDAMAWLYLAAIKIGGDYTLYQESTWRSMITTTYIDASMNPNLYPEFIWSYDQYDCGDIGKFHLDVAPIAYNLERFSFVSSEHPFSANNNSHVLDVGEELSYARAAIAVQRLISSANPDMFPQYGESAEFNTLLENRKAEIRNAVTEIHASGTTYYVSNQGNDANDGKTPETAWQSFRRAADAETKPGDCILFERGGTWYVPVYDEETGAEYVADFDEGVTVSAYGEGPKPVLRGDLPEANNPDFWILDFEDGEKKIWRSAKDLTDSTVLVLNNGEETAQEVIPWLSADEEYINPDGSPFDVKEALYKDLTFSCMLDIHSEKRGHSPTGHTWTAVTGPLYFRCDRGNPADVYDEIAVPQMSLIQLYNDGTMADLDLRYFTMTAAAVTSHTVTRRGQTFKNLEISWCGGFLQDYLEYGPEKMYFPTAGGGGLNIAANDCTAENCLFYQCATFALIAGVHRNVPEPGRETMSGTTAKGNVFEECATAFHTAGYAEVDNPGSESYVINMVFEDNVIKESGKCWIQNMNQEKGRSFVLVENLAGAMENDGVYIRNNTIFNHGFYATFGEALSKIASTVPPNQYIRFSGNHVIQMKGIPLYETNSNNDYRWIYPDQGSMADIVRDESGILEVIGE